MTYTYSIKTIDGRLLHVVASNAAEAIAKLGLKAEEVKRTLPTKCLDTVKPGDYCGACSEVRSACICPPRIEQTEAGAQVVIIGTPERRVPTTPLKPRRPQSTKPLELEMPAINAAQLGLF